MAMTATPVYSQTPKHVVAQVSVANTNVDGTTGTYATVLTAGANGSKIERIRIQTQGTTTADKVRLFIGGKLYGEFLFAAATPSNTVTVLTTDIDCTVPGTTLVMTAAEVMIANINTGAGNLINIHVFYGDY